MSQLPWNPSIEYNVSRAAYGAIPAVNWSRLKLMARSASHYYRANDARTDTDAMLFGRVVHLLVLEPDQCQDKIAVFDGRRFGRAWDDFQIENSGKEIIKCGPFEDAFRMAEMVRKECGALLSGGRAEATATWLIGDRKCKGRFDFLPDSGILVDMKTARDASPEEFGRSAFRLMYHCQLAWYLDGLTRITGMADPRAVIIAIEKNSNEVAIYDVGERDIELGRKTYTDLLAKFESCVKSGEWTGYGRGPLQLPGWAFGTGEMSGLGLTVGGKPMMDEEGDEGEADDEL
jgi:exodeoxyribonuclease VIII